MRWSPSIALRFAVALAASVVTIVACKGSSRETSCNTDVDCVEGSFCVEKICAEVRRDDGGVEEGGPVSCVGAGGSCSSDDECCTRPCTGFRCAGGTGTSGGRTSSSSSSGTSGTSSGSTSSGGSCTDLYGLCSVTTDCCIGLACDDNGTCR